MTQGQKIIGIAMAESLVILGIIGAFLAGYLSPIGLAISIAVLASFTGAIIMLVVKPANTTEVNPLERDRQNEQ
jgi:uncharacterized membrane protein YeaQ/YmgE (transglycosylase-associated protein family)